MRSTPLLLLCCACVTSQVLVPNEQRATLKRDLEGTERYLKVSFFATPFFGDATKKLLTDVPPDQVRLLEQPNGTPINPGAVEATFPAGTLVRIKALEFPDALATDRVLMTPRTVPWVFLDVAGTPRDAPPYVLVLRQGIQDDRELNAEVDRYLAREDPKAKLTGFSEVVQNAIAAKKAVIDMPAEALEMAWGYPERRVLAFEGDKKKETWIWAGEQRQAVLLDGRVAEVR
jgi:hypothetical protein